MLVVTLDYEYVSWLARLQWMKTRIHPIDFYHNIERTASDVSLCLLCLLCFLCFLCFLCLLCFMCLLCFRCKSLYIFVYVVSSSSSSSSSSPIFLFFPTFPMYDNDCTSLYTSKYHTYMFTSKSLSFSISAYM